MRTDMLIKMAAHAPQEMQVKGQAVIYKGEAYTYFDSGLSRHVFVNAEKTKVIKLLVDKRGYQFNKEEFDIYSKASDDIKNKMAHTQISPDGLVIEQEFVTPIKMSDKQMTMPQILFANSCRDEVGWNDKGELVCFDLDEFKKY